MALNVNIIGRDSEGNLRALKVNSEGNLEISEPGWWSSIRFLSGTTNPTPEIGVPGDVYLNTSSGDLFKNDNGTWNIQMNLVGPEGPEGADGFGTEAQYNNIIARLEALESAGA